ncbi:MAG: hypothetical protein ACHQAV_04040 [Solirubrobacterales bacterium]
MKLVKVLSIALVAVSASCITAASASALPDISITLGGSYPLQLHFADNGKTSWKLETTGGSKLEGKGLSLLLSVAELSALGKFEAIILGVKDNKTACNSKGAKTEEVLTKGTFHIVFTPSVAGLLFLVEEVEIECGKVKVKVRGSAIASLNAAEGEITEVGDKLEGAKGKNALETYLNDEGKEVKGIIEANFGTGFVQADEAFGEEVKLAAVESKMFELKPPDLVEGQATNPAEPVGPGHPFTFGANVRSRNLILRNPAIIRRQFLNGLPEFGRPGELNVNPGGNFGINSVGGAEKCLEIIAGGAKCEETLTSAAGGVKGEYTLKYGTPANELELKFKVES